MDLSIIITSLNCKDVLLPCLESIKGSQTKYSWEVILYDHGSTDGTAQVVESSYPWVKLIHGGDVGFAKGNNAAVKESSGRYVLLLNADTKLEETTLEVMLNFMEEHPDVGMSTCKLVLAVNGQLDKACRRSFPTPWVSFTRFSGLSSLFPKSELFNRYNLGYLSEDDEYEIDSCVGAFQLTRREVVDKIGGLDETFYMYGEDIDWCYRNKQAGWKVYYYPRVKTWHFKGYQSNSRETKKSRPRPRPLWEFHRAMILFYKKHYQQKYPYLLNKFIYTAIWARYLIQSRLSLYKPLPELIKETRLSK